MSIFRSSIFLAALVAIAAAGWILSGQFDETATARQPESATQAASEREVPRTRVRTFVSRAEPYTERVIATARQLLGVDHPNLEQVLEVDDTGALNEWWAI